MVDKSALGNNETRAGTQPAWTMAVSRLLVVKEQSGSTEFCSWNILWTPKTNGTVQVPTLVHKPGEILCIRGQASVEHNVV